jgi:hypothetical protein
MTQKYDLSTIFGSINRAMTTLLQIARTTAGHPSDKGDASESDWVKLFNDYLPQRYQALKCHVIDSKNAVSDQIDVAIIDRQYTPFIWQHNGINVVPVEAVYAVFEVKQELNKSHIEYAHKKIGSVRRLHKTSLPIPHAGGIYPPKPNIAIIGGILTLSSSYSPFFSEATAEALAIHDEHEAIDLGSVADSGGFRRHPDDNYYAHRMSETPVAAFMLELISMLQELGTVPMIDIDAYAKWLD